MNYYKEIKNKILDNEAYERVKDYSKERHRVLTYFEIGRLLHEAGKHYGDSVIKKYSKSLTKEIGKKYNERTLWRMRQFYILFNEPKLALPVSSDQKVSSHNNKISKSPYIKEKNNKKVSSHYLITQRGATLDANIYNIRQRITKLTWTHYVYLITINNDVERIISREYKLI